MADVSGWDILLNYIRGRSQSAPTDRYGLPIVPPLRSEPELHSYPSGPRPESATAPIERTLADTMMAAPAAGYEGGRMIAEGYKAGSPTEMGRGAATMAMGLIPGYRKQPKWTRMLEPETPAQTSHAGMAPWLGAPGGAALGGYLGSLADDSLGGPGTIGGGLAGALVGGGLGTWGLARFLRAEEARRLAEAAAASASTLPSRRVPLAQRLADLQHLIPPRPQAPPGPSLRPDLVAGPLGPTVPPSGTATRLLAGKRIYQDANGVWRDAKSKIVEGPSGAELSEGFEELPAYLTRR